MRALRSPLILGTLLVGALVLTACASGERSPRTDSAREAAAQAEHVRDVVASGGVVDSVRPIAEHLRRFRAALPPVDTFRHASASREALVARLARAVGTRDTAALNAMALDRREFAWLFYESSPLARPPYEAPPELLWGQILTASDEGARQLVNRFGGSTVTADRLVCPDAAEIEGENRLYKRCRVRFTAPGRRTLEGDLFGTIVERHGRFKFVGYANRI